MARSTMVDLIETLRGMTQAGQADYTVAGVSYWSDDQLQAVLDRHRLDVHHELLRSVESWQGGGSVAYYDYYSEHGSFEHTGGGTALFIVEDSTGTNAGTALWTADYSRGQVTFSADTKGIRYYLSGRSYDLNGAAADVWRQKASQVALTGYSWSTDNMRVDKSSVQAAYFAQARVFDALARPQTIYVDRGDAGYDATR